MLETAILATLGVIVAFMAILLYQHILKRLDTYLEEHHNDLWTQWGTGNAGLRRSAQFRRLRELALQHESDDLGLAAMLISTSRWYYGIRISTAVIAGLIVFVLVFAH